MKPVGVACIDVSLDIEPCIDWVPLSIVKLDVRWWRRPHYGGVMKLVSTKFFPADFHHAITQMQTGVLHGGTEG